MALSSDLISQFVKTTNDKPKTSTEATVQGVVKYGDRLYVMIDGSDHLTPVSTTTDVEDGERVTVTIKDHTATITGNMSSPSARTDSVKDVAKQVSDFEIVIADKVSTKEFDAEVARINSLTADNVTIKENLTAASADIEELRAKNITIEGTLTAQDAKIENLETTKIDAIVVESEYATIKNLEATNADIYNLNATYGKFVDLTTENFKAVNAEITNLDTKYANIDFANVGDASFENFYAQSGLIENVTISEGTITGSLIGVTIKGDLIEGGTVVADKLVVLGDDGLYYKLNFEAGTFTDAEEVPRDSLHGSIITAKSVTAEKVSVDDLIAFDATLGGFHIGANSLYSDVKQSIDNSTRGIYMDTDGQVYFGDANNYIRYYKDTDEDGNEIYRLAISAESIIFGADAKSSAADLKTLTEHVKIGTYTDPETDEENPCVELSEGDSNFKQVITNTKTMFMDGDRINTEINTDGIDTENLNVTQEFQHGKWIWIPRENGNLGLVWKGVDS